MLMQMINKEEPVDSKPQLQSYSNKCETMSDENGRERERVAIGVGEVVRNT